MLSIIYGKPGEGKTYKAVALDILPKLLKGGLVYTNIEMRPEAIRALFLKRYGLDFNADRLRFLTRQQAPRFFDHVPAGRMGENVLVVIDEAHKFFNSRDHTRNDKDLRDTFNKVSEHRHHHLDIILLSQSREKIDPQLRRDSSFQYKMRNLNNWHFPRMPWLKIPYYDFVCVKIDQDAKTLADRDWLKMDKAVAGCYNTHSVEEQDRLQSGTDGHESLAVSPEHHARVRKLRMWSKFGFLCLLLSVAYWFGTRQVEKVKKTAVSDAPKSPIVRERVTAPARSNNLSSSSERSPETKSAYHPPVYLESPPEVPLLLVEWWSRRAGQIMLCVEMDGARQHLLPGEWCSRGRVGSIVKPGGPYGRVFLIVLHDDNGQIVPLRGILKPPSPASVPDYTGFGKSALPDPNIQSHDKP